MTIVASRIGTYHNVPPVPLTGSFLVFGFEFFNVPAHAGYIGTARSLLTGHNVLTIES